MPSSFAIVNRKTSIFIADAILFLLLLNFLPLDSELAKGLSILIFVAILWLTEAIHISVTALLVPMLAIALGIFPTASAFSHFADPIIFLFLGGFALASALSKQELDRAIAGVVLIVANGKLKTAVFLLFGVSAFLSMWISNTATAAMMLPLVIGMLSQLDRTEHGRTWIFTLLGVAYCSSIGGIATLVGSPPNAIAAAETGISFIEWMQKALPLTLILLPTAVAVLYWVIKPNLNHTIRVEKYTIAWHKQQKITLAIFSATVFCWIFSTPINRLLGGISAFDSYIAISALIALAASGVVKWKDIESTTDWGVLVLFGGGLCLSAILKATGSSLFLGQSLGEIIGAAGPLVAIAMIASFVVFLTEFTSNTASAALLVPVFAAIAPTLGIDPVALATLIAVAASCAFMLPVATPPNAIVFGSGFVPQTVMMRCGIWLNLMCIIVLSLYAAAFW